MIEKNCFCSTTSNLGSISAALSCLVYPPHSGEERGLVSRTAAGNRAYKGPHRELLGYLSGQAPEPKNYSNKHPFPFHIGAPHPKSPGIICWYQCKHLWSTVCVLVRHLPWQLNERNSWSFWLILVDVLGNFPNGYSFWTGPRKFIYPEMQAGLDEIARFHEISSKWVNVHGLTILENFS